MHTDNLEQQVLKLKISGPQDPQSYHRALERYQRLNKEGRLAKPKYTPRSSAYYG